MAKLTHEQIVHYYGMRVYANRLENLIWSAATPASTTYRACRRGQELIDTPDQDLWLLIEAYEGFINKHHLQEALAS